MLCAQLDAIVRDGVAILVTAGFERVANCGFAQRSALFIYLSISYPKVMRLSDGGCFQCSNRLEFLCEFWPPSFERLMSISLSLSFTFQYFWVYCSCL